MAKDIRLPLGASLQSRPVHTTVTTFANAEAYDDFMRGFHERVTQRARERTPPPFKGEKLEAYDVLLSN